MYSGEQLCLDLEEWRDVVGYETRYEVSNLGRVRSKDYYYFVEQCGNVFHKGRILGYKGYKRSSVCLCVDGVERITYRDELVLNAFVREKGDDEAAYHIDGDVTNDCLGNLMWVTDEMLHDMWIDGSTTQPREIESLASEEWRDAVGFDGRFKVSNCGRVTSIDRLMATKKHGLAVSYGMILSQYKDRQGYMKVNLSEYGKKYVKPVHRLVADAFIDNPNHLPEVDHVDAVRDNNHVSNLRHVSKEENIRHMMELGNHVTKIGEIRYTDEFLNGMVGRSKPLVREDGKTYESITEAANDLGCSKSFVSKHVHGRYKTCMGHVLKLKNG